MYYYYLFIIKFDFYRKCYEFLLHCHDEKNIHETNQFSLRIKN